MAWIEVFSWLVVAFIVAALHAWLPKERYEHPTGIFIAGFIGALAGGYAVYLLHVGKLAVGGYSFSALIAAGVLAEAGILIALSTRDGERTKPLAP